MIADHFNVKVRHPYISAGIALAWFLLVIGGVHFAQGLVDLWGRQGGELHLTKSNLRRLQGWIEAREQIQNKRQGLLGAVPQSNLSELTWFSLQTVQEVAQEAGLSVGELRPVHIPGRGVHLGVVRLDLKLEGTLQQLGTFLNKFPEQMPGVLLQNLQISPLGGTQVQGLLQMSLSEEVYRP